MKEQKPIKVNKNQEENIINSPTFTIYSDKKNEYSLLFQNTKELLYISCQNKNNNNLLYKNKFSLYEIQKTKLFIAYDTIDECLFEINNILNEKKGIIKEEEEDKLSFVVPLNSKKYPEIIFPLYKKEKSDSQKINDLYKIINEEKKQINDLKKTLDDFIINQEITIYGTKEEVNGISVDFKVFGKEDLKEYLGEKLDFELEPNYYYTVISINRIKNDKYNEINLELLNEIKKSLEKNWDFRSLLRNIKDTRLIVNENKISIISENGFEINKDFENFISYDFKNIRGNFKTEFEAKDVLNYYLNHYLDSSKFCKFKFDLKGLTINSKLIIKDFINEITSSNYDDSSLEEILSEIGFETFKYYLKTLKVALSSQKANLFIDAHNTLIEIIGKIILEDNIQNIVSIIGYIIEDL